MTVRDRLFEASERVRRESAQAGEGEMPREDMRPPDAVKAELRHGLRDWLRYGRRRNLTDAEMREVVNKTLEEAFAEIE